MPLDGLTFYHIARELDARLAGGRVDKVQQPERDEIILTIRNGGENHLLLLCASADCARAHITGAKRANPLEPPNLCMLLRKHLLGARLARVEQINSDRILAFTFDHLDEMGDPTHKTVYCEFMGKHSNLILVNAAGRIMESARRVNETMSGVREVLPGLKYELPPFHEKLPFDSVTAEDLEARLTGQSGSLAKLIRDNVSGFSLPLAKELVYRLTGDAELLTDCPEKYGPKIANEVRRLLDSPAPRILLSGKGDLQAVEYKSCGGLKIQEFEHLSEAIDEFYLQREQTERINQKSASIHRVIKANIDRLEKKIILQEEALTIGERADEYRIKGELLTASPYLVKKGMKTVQLPNYYDPDTALITVELDEKLNAAANAQRYFKLYKKAQVARKLAGEQLIATREELEYLEGQAENLTKCTDEATLAELKEELIRLGYVKDTASRREKKALPPSKPYELTAPDGTLILVGRNNLQNDRLTLSALPEEIWLHTKDIPGSHVIIKSSAPSNETLLYAARVAARYSKAGASSNVPVDYAQRKFVKKPAGAKPGKVIYTHQHTLIVAPADTAPRD